MHILSSLQLLIEVNWLLTFRFNLHYLSLSQAIKLPVWIYRHTKIARMRGYVQLGVPVSPGMFRIGCPYVGTIDSHKERTLVEIGGGLIINGHGRIGSGSRVSIGNNGILSFGRNFKITGGTSIICNKSISFGNDCLLSWDILFMDTDFHEIRDAEGIVVNHPRPISIGNHVWIGCRTTVLKGATVADGVIITASSVITTNLEERNCVYGGSGRNVSLLKRDVYW